MNFFEAQDRARRASKWLVVVYLVATALIVLGVTSIVGAAIYMLSESHNSVEQFVFYQSPTLVGTAIFTALFIVGATLYKTAALASGGGRVAAALGGTQVSADTTDPLRRRLRNVVEEMAIASGLPVPEIYVLEEEPGINAFAAGFSPGDAAVAVTRGALELLDRDELQGVIAHEFSHILNGDMRLNIRMMGVLFGIIVLGLIGRLVLRGGYHTGVGRRGRGAPVVFLVGVGLSLLGAIGVFFARIIKAAVSRQREYLADASAVQFTRQSAGIASALKKIGGFAPASYITAADPEEVSHMLFGSGSKLFGPFATHPPLTDRIKALDPSFKESDFPRVDPVAARLIGEVAAASERVEGVTSALASSGTVVLPESIADTVGQPDSEHIEYARGLRAAIPDSLYDAAHSLELSLLLCIALVLDRDGRSLESQLRLVEERLGADRTRQVKSYFNELEATGAEFRLPLLEVAFPALKARPAPQLAYLLELASRLIEVDGDIDLYEYCFYRLLRINIGQSLGPVSSSKPRRASKRALRKAAIDLLAVLADQGHDADADKRAAFAAGLEVFGEWAAGTAFSPPEALVRTATLDASLDLLLRLNGKARRQLVRAISAVAGHDRRLTVTEAELIRIVCASLECPLPPLLVDPDQLIVNAPAE
ncbi:MAG: M48 family metallopeptidase [Woeseiaceae bacterium]|nr:M48 family metallopeptidase [Woeseiaceae bacterium]